MSSTSTVLDRLGRNFLRRRAGARLLNDLSMVHLPGSIRLLPARDIEEDSLDGTRHGLAALDNRVHTHTERGTEHPEDPHRHPACEELLAEHVAGAVHGHGPEHKQRKREEDSEIARSLGRLEQLRLLGGLLLGRLGFHGRDHLWVEVSRGGEIAVVTPADFLHSSPVVVVGAQSEGQDGYEDNW